jgi:hypothetical protein
MANIWELLQQIKALWMASNFDLVMYHLSRPFWGPGSLIGHNEVDFKYSTVLYLRKLIDIRVRTDLTCRCFLCTCGRKLVQVLDTMSFGRITSTRISLFPWFLVFTMISLHLKFWPHAPADQVAYLKRTIPSIPQKLLQFDDLFD